MSTGSSTDPPRTSYEEFTFGAETVAKITDRDNADAWVESDTTWPVEP